LGISETSLSSQSLALVVTT